jgi:tRNA-2-methylthio-N6-dimethylallyladenosine synthase
MKVYIETFGCQMNQLDSELMADYLRYSGYEIRSDRRDADVVLYNTCSVRDHAEQKVYSRLGKDRQRKHTGGRKQIIGVVGCMAQRLGGQLSKRFEAVDIICSPGMLHRLPDMLSQAGKGPVVALDGARGADDEGQLEKLDTSRVPSGASRRAFVRIMRGCERFCSYCIVPHVRGAERSRDPDNIMSETARLVESGKDCITLLGQTVNRYRFQGGSGTVRFNDLLGRLSALNGLRRLDFVTSHPVDFGQDILEAMRDLPNVCNYIHCPAQSGSDRMLRAMNRGYTSAEYDALVDTARDMVSDVTIASDFIVGFPGETEEDHEMSADLIRRSGFKNSFIFKYSPRPGTAAAELEDDVPDAVKRRRNNELLEVQKQVGLAHHRSYINRVVQVLVDGPSRRFDRQSQPPDSERMQLSGRTTGNHIVLFYGPESLVNDYVDVRVTGANELALIGETT